MGFSVKTINGEVVITERTGDDVFRSSATEVNTNSLQGQLRAFRKSSAVQTAITMRVNAFANLNVWAKDDRGKKVINSIVKADMATMAKMNPYQTFHAFNSQVEAYCSIFGKCYIYKSRIVGFPNEFDCYIIPNNIISPSYAIQTDALFQRKVDHYDITLVTGMLRLEADEVVVINDNCFSLGGYGFGESRLIALAEPISTLLSIGETRTQLTADGGMRGIISQDAKDIDMLSAPFLDTEKKSLQAELKKYGGLREQFKYMITKGSINYIPLTSKIVDMDLTASALEATVQIYNRYGLQSIFAAKEPRFKAYPEGRKEFYTGAIIPEATPRFAELALCKGIPKREWEYKPDWSHMDFFQEALLQSGTALQQVMNAITPARKEGFISQEQYMSILEPYLE